jgi:hypothetical protein
MKYEQLKRAMDKFIAEYGLNVLCRDIRVAYINGEPFFKLKEGLC